MKDSDSLILEELYENLNIVWARGGDIREVDGQCGYGVYCFPFANKAMLNYYTKNGEILYIIQPTSEVVDTRRHVETIIKYAKMQNIKCNSTDYYKQPFALKAFMLNEYPNASGYICPHKGEGIPTGIQAIFDIDKIDTEVYEM